MLGGSAFRSVLGAAGAGGLTPVLTVVLLVVLGGVKALLLLVGLLVRVWAG